MFTSVAALVATGCGGDDDNSGTGGRGATGGKGGSAGKGGAGGATGGKAGAGTAGSGVTGGSAGKGGGGGTSGAGKGGSGGTAGATGGTAGGTMGGEGGLGAAGEAGAGGAAAAVTCDGYCDTLMAACGTTGADAQYPSTAQCIATCATFPTNVTTGNSLGCRFDHANLAATVGVDPHCDHAGPAGLGPCGGACAGYCSMMMAVCSSKFADEAACLLACAAVPGNNFMDYAYPAPAGDNLTCRIAHASNAAASVGATRDLHCAHAAGEMAPCAP